MNYLKITALFALTIVLYACPQKEETTTRHYVIDNQTSEILSFDMAVLDGNNTSVTDGEILPNAETKIYTAYWSASTSSLASDVFGSLLIRTATDTLIKNVNNDDWVNITPTSVEQKWVLTIE